MLVLCVMAHTTPAQQAPPPEPPNGMEAVQGFYEGPLDAARTYTGGRWRPPPSHQGKISPWVGLVKNTTVPAGNEGTAATTTLQEFYDVPLYERESPAMLPMVGRPMGWVLLRNPSPVPITPALLTRWDMLAPKDQGDLQAVLFGTGQAVDPNLPTWPPGALLWLRLGKPPEEPAADDSLMPLYVEPLRGKTEHEEPPATEDPRPCHHLRLAYELDALSSPTGIPDYTRSLPVCRALTVLAERSFKRLAMPPGNPTAGRYGQTLTTSIVLPTDTGVAHPALSRFRPSFPLRTAGGRWVLSAPVSYFYLRDSLEQSGLAHLPLPKPTPDGSYFNLETVDAMGVTFSFHTRLGQCETGCVYEAVCTVRVEDDRIAARAGDCD